MRNIMQRVKGSKIIERYGLKDPHDIFKPTYAGYLSDTQLQAYKIWSEGEMLDERVPLKHSHDEIRRELNQTVLSAPIVKAIRANGNIYALAIPQCIDEAEHVEVLCLPAGENPKDPDKWKSTSHLDYLSALRTKKLDTSMLQRRLGEDREEQDRFLAWIDTYGITDKVAWMASTLQNRGDAAYAWQICAEVAGKIPTDYCDELWKTLSAGEPPYKDLAVFALDGDLSKLQAALERHVELQTQVRNARMEYAQRNGLRMLERSNLIDERKAIIKPLMLEGRVPISIMMDIGNNYFANSDNLFERLEREKARELTRV